MGYETKMFICTTNKLSGDEKAYANPVGMVDLCVCGFFDSFIRINSENGIEFTHYMYDLDGNTQIIHDKYGDAIRVFDPLTFLRGLREEIKRSKENNGIIFRRFAMAEALIAKTYRKFSKNENLKIITFGH